MNKLLNKLIQCTLLVGMSAIATVTLAVLPSSTAWAETATFTTPVVGDPNSVLGAADGAGVLIAPGQSIGLLLSSPFALFADDGFTPINNAVSIITLSDIGSALGQISFGRYNDGVPQLFHSQNFSPDTNGVEIDFNFLAFVGCGAAGGCDYVQISATSAFNGSSGIIFDAATFNNVALSALITASAPEPAVWLLMICGFIGLSLQLKRLHRQKPKSVPAHVPDHLPVGGTLAASLS